MEKRRRIWKKRRFTAGAFKRLPAGQIRAAKGCEMSAKILNDDVYLILTKFKAPCHQHTCFLLLNFWIIFCDGQYLHLDLGAPIIKKIRPFRKFCRISLVYGFYRKRRTNLTEHLRAKNSMTSTILLRGVCGMNAWRPKTGLSKVELSTKTVKDAAGSWPLPPPVAHWGNYFLLQNSLSRVCQRQ